MSLINQKEYLKKYLKIGTKSGEKKKKKKTELTSGKGLKIIDDDVDTALSQEIQVDLDAANEDAPQIVAVIDDRPPSMRVDEKTKNHLWQPIGESSNNVAQFQSFKMGSIKLSRDNALNKFTEKKSKNISKSPARDFNNVYSSIEKYKRDDYSPTRKSNKSSEQDLPPKRFKQENIPSLRKIDKDSSPPRKKVIKRDYLPPRNRDEDYSPSRRTYNLSASKGNNVENDYSPSRKRSKDPSPTRGKGRSSPSTKKDVEKDYSPPRKNYKNYSPSKTIDKDSSPPRKKDRDKDYSPSRRKKGRQKDYSPLRKKDEDYSPPRRIDKSLTSPRTKHIDKDISPPRKRDKDYSPLRKTEQDLSPPRKKDKDYSPPRKKNRSSPSSRQDEDIISPRKNVESKKREKDHSPPTRKRSRWEDDDSSLSSRPEMTMSGKKSGLQNAQNLVEDIVRLQKKEEEMFKLMSAEISGVNATTVVRRKKDENVVDHEKEAREKELKEKYSVWGRGVKQVQDESEKYADIQKEMNKPLARYADDEDLEKYLKEQEREGDPMLAYIRKKKKKVAVEQGLPEKPTYMGDFMPNRFSIRPGYRWDGVDRSNGYEKKWFEVQNSKKAMQEEALKWSTEDM